MQGFERFARDHVRTHGLTHAQFDIIATLGNTKGMSYKDLGDKTLITKGTLTGVIERLEQKGCVERCRSTDDKRSFSVRLTPQGEAVFDTVFPSMMVQGKQLFTAFGEDDFLALEQILSRLKNVIDDGNGVMKPGKCCGGGDDQSSPNDNKAKEKH